MRFTRRTQGFTLIELLIVVAIVGILASLLMAAIGGVKRRTTIAVAKSQIQTIKAALAMYETDMGKYPRLVERTKAKCYDDDGAALYAALQNRPNKTTGGGQNAPYLQDWKTDDVGLVEDTSYFAASKMGSTGTPEWPWARRLTRDEVQDLRTKTFQTTHGPASNAPLVFLDPWGNPYHYREWASIRTSTKDELVAGPTSRTPDGSWNPDGGSTVPSADDAPHGLETFDIWSNGPNQINEYGHPDSDDVTSWGR